MSRKKRMIKLLMIISLILAAAGVSGCGGGNTSSNASDSLVTINISRAITTSRATGRLVSSSAIIPAEIVTIMFNISAADMAAIERTVYVDSKAVISESFMVPNGKNRRFSVAALDASGNILYKGETYADLDGSPAHLSITMVSTASVDISGTWSAWHTPQGGNEVGPDCITLTQSGNILSLSGTGFYGKQLTGSGTLNGDGMQLTFTAEAAFCAGTDTVNITGKVSSDGTAVSGSYTKTGGCLDHAGTWRAVKGSCTHTDDKTQPVFGGLTSATAYSATEANLSWNPASDNLTPSSNISYLIFMSTTPGGQNFLSPTYTSHPGDTSFTAFGLLPGATYYFVVRAQDGAGNIDTNTVEKSVTTMGGVSVSAAATASGGYATAPQDNIIDATASIPAGKTVKRITVTLEWGSYSIPDQFQVIYEGNVIYDTSMVSDTGVINVSHDGTSPKVTIRVITNEPNTVWDWSATVIFTLQ